MDSLPRLFLDSNVLTAFARGEARQAEYIGMIFELLANSRARVACSALSLFECRTSKDTALSDDEHGKIKKFFQAFPMVTVAADAVICTSVGDMFQSHNSQSRPAWADCIIVCSAIQWKADMLITLDGTGAKGRPGRTHMLDLNKRIGSPPLQILSPLEAVVELGIITSKDNAVDMFVENDISLERESSSKDS
jgi:hypothetical protein